MARTNEIFNFSVHLRKKVRNHWYTLYPKFTFPPPEKSFYLPLITTLVNYDTRKHALYIFYQWTRIELCSGSRTAYGACVKPANKLKKSVLLENFFFNNVRLINIRDHVITTYTRPKTWYPASRKSISRSLQYCVTRKGATRRVYFFHHHPRAIAIHTATVT